MRPLVNELSSADILTAGDHLSSARFDTLEKVAEVCESVRSGQPDQNLALPRRISDDTRAQMI